MRTKHNQLTHQQIRTRIKEYDRMIVEWRDCQVIIGEGRISDGLELDIADLQSWRNQLEWFYHSARRIKAARRIVMN